MPSFTEGYAFIPRLHNGRDAASADFFVSRFPTPDSAGCCHEFLSPECISVLLGTKEMYCLKSRQYKACIFTVRRVCSAYIGSSAYTEPGAFQLKPGQPLPDRSVFSEHCIMRLPSFAITDRPSRSLFQLFYRQAASRHSIIPHLRQAQATVRGRCHPAREGYAAGQHPAPQ